MNEVQTNRAVCLYLKKVFPKTKFFTTFEPGILHSIRRFMLKEKFFPEIVIEEKRHGHEGILLVITNTPSVTEEGKSKRIIDFAYIEKMKKQGFKTTICFGYTNTIAKVNEYLK
jgi:hypothetical protein